MPFTTQHIRIGSTFGSINGPGEALFVALLDVAVNWSLTAI